MKKDVFKAGDVIKDSVSVRLPDTTNIKKEFAMLRDGNQKRYLEIEVDVTHGGYVNKNGYYYTPEGQAQAVLSFYSPYPKPVLVHHDGARDPIGRTYAAAFVLLPAAIDATTKDDMTTPKSKIRVKSIITDEAAIEKILDKRYMTVSSGGSAKTMPMCSICGNPVNHDDCDHDRNQVYDGKKCHWKIGQMDYQEYSFENLPADNSDEHVASVVSMNLVQSDTTNSDVHGFDNPGAKEDALKQTTIKDSTESMTTCKKCNTAFDYTKQTEVTAGAVACPHCKINVSQTGDVISKASDSTGGTKMDEKELADFLATLFQVLDECPGCGDESKVGTEWTDATEITQAEELGKEFDTIMETLLGDAKLTAEQRKNMSSETFCGPNRSFPVPDCKHASVAMSYLGNPRVQAKYSSSVRSRIATCVRGKAKKMGCPMSKSGDSDLAPKVTELSTQVTTLTAENAKLKTDAQAKDAQITEANTKIADLHKGSKRSLAEKVVDLSLITHRKTVQSIVIEKDAVERKKKYDAMVEELMKRTNESLQDSINDLSGEMEFDATKFERVGDPTATISKKEDKTQTRVDLADKLFKPEEE